MSSMRRICSMRAIGGRASRFLRPSSRRGPLTRRAGWLAACCRISTLAEDVNRLPAGPDLAPEMLAQAPIGSCAFLTAVRSSRVPLLAERVSVRVCKGLGMTAI
jgi:hypothetical protein